MRFLFAALTLALAAGSCSREPRTELFNGRDLTGWVCVTDPEGVGDARDAFSVQNGNIRIAGSPFGYMRTEETYDDYRLHVEWRWIGEATNSGIFQRVQAGDRLWPEAVECQLQAGRAGDLLGESNVTTYIYKPVQPLATIKRHIVIIPSQAEKEAGFLMWLHKIGNLARNTGTKIVVYAPETTLKYIEPLRRKQTATVETVLFKDWEKLPALLRELRTDDCLWLAMSRRERISYQPTMNKIPAYLDQYLGRNSFVLIYPVQAGDPESRYL